MEHTGTVKRIFDARGFGFVQAKNGDEWFFYALDAGFANLCVGDRVAFTLGTRRESGRAEARQVRPA